MSANNNFKFYSLVFVLTLLTPYLVAAEDSYDLEHCINHALEHNSEILKAKEQIEKQYQVVTQTRANFFPRVDLQSTFNQKDKKRLSAFNGTTFGSDKDWSAEVIVSEQIFQGGANLAQLNRAKLLREAARFELESIVNNVLLEVQEKYFEVLLSRDQLLVQQENVKLLEEELKSEKSKLSAGTVSDFNVLRAQVALANGRVPFIRARDNTTIALQELKRVLGLTAETNLSSINFDVIGQLKFQPTQIELLQALQIAKNNRPELKRLKTILSAEKQGIKIAQSAFFPSLKVQGTYGAEKSLFSNDLEDNIHGWTFGTTATWNIFDSFATSAQIKQARSDESLARLSLKQSELDVEVEVRRAFSSLSEATELVKSSTEVVKQAEESLRLAKARFDVGSSTQLEVFDSQVALTQARSNQVQALYDYNVAKTRLDRAVGKSLK